MKLRIQIGAVLMALIALAVPARAQLGPDTRPLFSHYDLSSASLIYCVYDRVAQSPADNRIQTAGSNTTVTAVSGTPFANLTQWAEIYTPLGTRTVTAKASSVSVTVDTAIDLTGGQAFTYRNLLCGTTATDGWVAVSNFSSFRLTWVLEQITGTSIDMRYECIDAAPAATPVIVYPGPDDTVGCGAGTIAGGFCNFTAAGTLALDVFAGWDKCRIGMKLNTDTGVQKITGIMAGKR